MLIIYSCCRGCRKFFNSVNHTLCLLLEPIPYISVIVVLVADVLGRVLVNPRELQVGVLASAVGSLVLIFLMRRALGSRGL